MYVILIKLKTEWMATAKFQKNLVDKEKDVENEF